MPNENYPKVHPNAKSGTLVCGRCQWFASGFNGATCQKIRDVQIDTPACVEFKEYLEDQFHEVMDDKYIHGVRESLRGNRFKLNEQAILEELRTYNLDHNLMQFTYGSTQDLESVGVAMRKIVAYRARVSSIYTSLIDMQHDLDEIMSQASLWLYSKYPMIRDLKNETQRKAAFDRLVPEQIFISKSISKLMATSKYVDEKLDSNERALGRILSSAEKLWFSKEKPFGNGSTITWKV